MYEPALAPRSDDDPLPTSWAPNETKRLRDEPNPWQEYAVGFRICGRSDTTVRRTLEDGCTQQRVDIGRMRANGYFLEGTVAFDQTRALFWTRNHDIFNESAVCVSRNLFGATAFPERSTNDEIENKTSYLFALNCAGLSGFDTEAEQVRHNRVWRPGEKAYQSISARRVIAWVRIRRLGGNTVNGWDFLIEDTWNWEFTSHHGGADTHQIKYIKEELIAWRGRHHIDGKYDFTNAAAREPTIGREL